MPRLDIRLGLERLGSRILPSASPLGLAAHSAPVFLGPPVAQPPRPLSGGGHGSYSYDAVQSGAGTEYRLDGSASLSGMGAARVSGSVHSVGFIQQGRAGGELTFTDARGSVTVDLTGPTQAGFSPLPGSFRFHVVGGTGAYAHSHWRDGTLTLSLRPGSSNDPAAPHGTFDIDLNPPLSGAGHGSYSRDLIQSGAGTEFRLQGSASLSGMGQFTVGGSVHSLGFIRQGRAGGKLTFTDAGGSLTVELTGPTQAGFSPLPGTFRFHVAGGTGDYAGRAWDDGTLTLSLKSGPAAAQGAFEIALNPHGGHAG